VGDCGRLKPALQERADGRLPQRLAGALLLPLPKPQLIHVCILQEPEAIAILQGL
jgi:hypothetical protein